MAQSDLSKKIVVLGSGNFGTCLAHHVADKGYDVTIWSRSADSVRSINERHINPKYLSSFELSPRIKATTELDRSLFANAAAIILAIPTQATRQVLEAAKGAISAETAIICANKGIEISTLSLPMTIVSDVLGASFGEQAVVLSGPSFAVEVMTKQPTAISLASKDAARCQLAQDILHASHFRAYTSDDPVGLEVAGALKNVIAIASGACSGLGYQQNSKAALLTRGLAEITRVGVALGANPLTFTGLGGVGDLFLTCTSEKSRNFTVGYRLGRGESLDYIIESMGSVAEGVATAKAAHRLGKKLGVDTPITDQVYSVLYEGVSIADAVMTLLTREAKPEISLPLA